MSLKFKNKKSATSQLQNHKSSKGSGVFVLVSKCIHKSHLHFNLPKYVTVILLFVLNTSYAQTAHKYLLQGDEKYNAQDFASAEELYRKADQKNSTLKSSYNLGNTTFKQERYEESIDYYINAARKAKTDEQESDAFYNLGNAHFNNQELEEAIEAFKQSIRLNPNNKEAKYNLAVAKEIKKQMMQQDQEQQQQENQDQQDQENQDQEDQDQQDQEQQENQEQQDQEDSEEQEGQEEQQDSTQQIQESQFDSTRLDKQELDSLDAAKLLQIIQSEEQKVQEKLRKFNSNRKKPDKDW